MSYDDDSIYDANDDDVFAKSSNPSSDGSGSPSYMINNSRVPGYLRDALERYIRENPHIKESFRHFRDPSVLTNFIALFSVFDQSIHHFHPPRPKNNLGPIRALIHVLDNQYEGLIRRLTAVYDIEGELQQLHSNYITILQLHEAIATSTHEPTQLSQTMLIYLGVLSDITSFSIKSLIQKYADACELACVEQDEKLVKFGIVTEGDFAYAVTNATPQLALHFKYGDVSSIGADVEESYRSIFIKFLLPIIFADDKEATELINEFANKN